MNIGFSPVAYILAFMSDYVHLPYKYKIIEIYLLVDRYYFYVNMDMSYMAGGHFDLCATTRMLT